LSIRVHQLAKELNVRSKDIITKCKAEGLDVKSHNSVLSAGLEATVREWFSEGAHTTTVEEAEKVDLKKVKRKPRKKKAKEGEEKETRKKKTKKKEPEETAAEEAAEEAPEEAVAVAPEGVVEQAESDTVAAVEPPETTPEAKAETPLPEAELAPSEEEVKEEPAEAVAEVTPEEQPSAEKVETPEEEKAEKEGEEEAKIIPAGPQLVPAPAQLRGPTVVRVESPEFIHRKKPKPVEKEIIEPEIPLPQKGKGKSKTEEDRKAKRPKPRHSRRGQRSYEVTERIKEWRDQDLLERRERLDQATGRLGRLTTEVKKSKKAEEGPALPKHVELPPNPTVRDMSALLGVKISDIISKLMNYGVMATVNQPLTAEAAELIASDYGVEVSRKKAEDLESKILSRLEETKPENRVSRAPVVTFLGHVDHGKTSLLDYIRKTEVAEGEAGGITQHIGAYRLDTPAKDGAPEKHVVFLDTPGHEAFTAMRARGANMTDVVVLVVAADDGVMPQTVEAIHHARAAGVAIVVALNKIDKPEANVHRVLGQLAEHDLTPAEWGGNIEVVKTSAVTGEGIADLVELLSLEAEMLELTADSTMSARGAVIEARMDEGRGVVANVLVQDGTLHVGDVIWAGVAGGRVRIITDSHGRSVEEAGPSTPVEIAGLDEVPQAGEKFYVLDDLSTVKQLTEKRREEKRKKSLATSPVLSLESLTEQIAAGQTEELCLVIKADVQGSIEVLTKSLNELGTSEVKVRILHTGVGAITEGDVLLAEASKAVVIGFHVAPDEHIREFADSHGVQLRHYSVIYELLDDVKKALEGLLKPDIEENILGHAEVRQVFRISRIGMVAGCIITDGVIRRNALARLVRDGMVVRDQSNIASLRRIKEDVREVRSGLECGIRLEAFDDVKTGDKIECYERVEVKRTL
jgi:translation initiation factor IF-2